MLKKFLFFTLCSLLITACSTKNKLPSDTEASAEPKEELSPLEEISKVCYDSPFEECADIFNKKAESIDEQARKIIDNYSRIYYILTSGDTVDYKQQTIESNMKPLKTKGYDIIIKRNKEEGNKHYVKLLEEKIYPLTQFYNSKKVDIGMDQFELIISMGFPVDINKTTTSNTVSEQWVYSETGIYVYLEDGIVTSFQN